MAVESLKCLIAATLWLFFLYDSFQDEGQNFKAASFNLPWLRKSWFPTFFPTFNNKLYTPPLKIYILQMFKSFKRLQSSWNMVITQDVRYVSGIYVGGVNSFSVFRSTRQCDLQYFHQQFWLRHRDDDGKKTSILKTERKCPSLEMLHFLFHFLLDPFPRFCVSETVRLRPWETGRSLTRW